MFIGFLFYSQSRAQWCADSFFHTNWDAKNGTPSDQPPGPGLASKRAQESNAMPSTPRTPRNGLSHSRSDSGGDSIWRGIKRQLSAAQRVWSVGATDGATGALPEYLAALLAQREPVTLERRMEESHDTPPGTSLWLPAGETLLRELQLPLTEVSHSVDAMLTTLVLYPYR